MRLDEREIAGASERIEDAPDLFEVRSSKRGRVPKREWPEIATLKPRKKRRITPPTSLPTPDSTQNSTQNAIYTSTDDLTEASSQVKTELAYSSQSSDKKTDTKQAWETEYERLKKKSIQQARDYLVQLIGNDEFPEVLRVPIVPPKILLNCATVPNDPLSVWRHFIDEEDLSYIAKHTNAQATAAREKQRLETPLIKRRKRRPWRKVTTTEIGGYFGALFLLGTQGAASLCDNWKVSEDSPLYPLSKYISLVRFQQIARYLKINRPGATNDSLQDKEFWHKVDPLASRFRAKCKANLQPGTVFAIDEQLRRNRGRWKHALQISSKAESKGVKIYSLCAGYYCYDFLFASKVVGVPEVRKIKPQNPKAKPFSNSELVVLTLIEQLQERHPGPLYLTLACDNFFTTHKLFAELKARGIAAYGTAKAGSGMPAQQVLLRDCTNKATDYGLLCNSVYDGVNHVTFVDQKAVHMMTTAHDVQNDELAWRDARTRRNACLERARESAGRTELPYPQLSRDYNHGMNSCDVASQLWSYYTVSRYSHWRNWWPMLWLILDASIANVLYLYRLRGYLESELSHKDLQTTIGLQLLRQPASVLRKRKPGVQVYGLKPTAIQQPLHQWVQPGGRGECVECKTGPINRGGRPRRGQKRTPLQDVSGNTPCQRQRAARSSYKCTECDVWLCKTSDCWSKHHLDIKD